MQRSRPRVVVLQSATGDWVTVVELSEPAQPGMRFIHAARAWDIVAVRARSGVLFARPSAA